MRPEPWAVKKSADGVWLVLREHEGGMPTFARRQYTSRGAIIIEGFWTTREAAERACARLNRKWAHECPGLRKCTGHGPADVHYCVPCGEWEAWDVENVRGTSHDTHAEAFAAALAFAREATC